MNRKLIRSGVIVLMIAAFVIVLAGIATNHDAFDNWGFGLPN